MKKHSLAVGLLMAGTILAAPHHAAAVCTPEERDGQYMGNFPSMNSILMSCWLIGYDENTVIENSSGQTITLADFQNGDDVHTEGCLNEDFTYDASKIVLMTAPAITCTTEFPGTFFSLNEADSFFFLSCWHADFDGSTVWEDSNGQTILPTDIPNMSEVTVTGCLTPQFTINASKVVWNVSGVSGLPSPADDQVTFDATGSSSFFISNTTNPAIGPTGSGNPNPSMTLEIGKRYMFSYANPGSHPFTLTSRAASAVSDSVLLVQGAGVGSFEGDAGVNWVDSGADFFFTLTPALASAMEANVGPGYRCNIHTTVMRGAITLSAPSSVEGWMTYE